MQEIARTPEPIQASSMNTRGAHLTENYKTPPLVSVLDVLKKEGSLMAVFAIRMQGFGAAQGSLLKIGAS